MEKKNMEELFTIYFFYKKITVLPESQFS